MIPFPSLAAGIALALIAFGTAHADAAFADECGPLKILASVDLRTEPPDDRPYVPVTLDGQPKYMLLDTGGTFSQLTQATVQALGLGTHKSTIRAYDISGNYTDQVAVVPSFAIATIGGSNVEFMVRPRPMPGDNSEIAGILAPNILRFYDLSVDFGAGKLTLLSQDHCPGKVVYWPASALAVVPMAITRMNGHIRVPVTLDGHRLNAEVDTGAYNSVLNLTDALSDLGYDTKQTGITPIGHLQNRNHDAVYRHTFHSLDFDGVAVSNPSIDIVPDLVRGQLDRPPPIGTRFRDTDAEQSLPDLLIGMDVLRHLHLYVAYKEQKLYITPSAQAAAVAATPKADRKSAETPAAGAAH